MSEIAAAFLGYLIGRIGDYYAGHWDFFHHWIYGIILMCIGVFTNIFILSFGLGLFISDFKDFYNCKIYGPDKKTIKRFWGFD